MSTRRLYIKAEFDSALADFNARLTTFEAGINSKIDSQVTSYLDRNGIWNGMDVDIITPFICSGYDYMDSDKGLKQYWYFANGSSSIKTTTASDLANAVSRNDSVDMPFIQNCNKSGLLMMSVSHFDGLHNIWWDDNTCKDLFISQDWDLVSLMTKKGGQRSFFYTKSNNLSDPYGFYIATDTRIIDSDGIQCYAHGWNKECLANVYGFQMQGPTFMKAGLGNSTTALFFVTKGKNYNITISHIGGYYENWSLLVSALTYPSGYSGPTPTRHFIGSSATFKQAQIY